LNVNCITKQGDNFVFDLTKNIKIPDDAHTQKIAYGANVTIHMISEEETGSMELLNDVKLQNIEQHITELQGQFETPNKEATYHKQQ
jgi:hypothetical protein